MNQLEEKVKEFEEKYGRKPGRKELEKLWAEKECDLRYKELYAELDREEVIAICHPTLTDLSEMLEGLEAMIAEEPELLEDEWTQKELARLKLEKAKMEKELEELLF